jgi:hypothetical protein
MRLVRTSRSSAEVGDRSQRVGDEVRCVVDVGGLEATGEPLLGADTVTELLGEWVVVAAECDEVVTVRRPRGRRRGSLAHTR